MRRVGAGGSSWRGTIALAVLVACVMPLVTGCSIGSKRVRYSGYPFDFTIDAVVEDRNVILFLIDGCRADLLYRMARDGELPSIDKYFIRRGVTVKNAVTSVPSITNAAIAAVSCGSYPGHLNVVGNRWFDRDGLRRINLISYRNYYQVNEFLRRETVYQMLGCEPTVTVSTPCIKGSTYNIHLHYNLVGAVNYLFKSYLNVDKVIVKEFRDVVEFAKREGLFPRVTFFHLMGTDYISHRYGPFSRETRRSLENADALLGELMGGLERNGVLDRFCVILVADHGQVETGDGNYFSLVSYLRRTTLLPVLSRYGEKDVYVTRALGLKPVTRYAEIDEKARGERRRHYENFAVIEANNGRNLFLYFRHYPDGGWVPPREMAPWNERPTWEELRNYPTPRGKVDLVDLMRGAEGCGFVVGRPAEGEIVIFSRGGEARIRSREQGGETMYSYAVVEGDDPLGYSGSPVAAKLMDGGYHGSREWKDATCALDQPDIVSQLPSLFESPFCGDLFLVAAAGWDFEKGHRGSHGGFLRDEMRVPLIIAGPGIGNGEMETARTVDIVPTILDYLGYSDRLKDRPLDGRSLWEEIATGY